MKTKKLHLIIIFLCLNFQPFYGQDTLSTRIADSYEAETYYLYNKQSGLGRLGSLTANSAGITAYSNNYPIRFAFKNEHNYFVNIANHNDDGLIYSDRSNWFRIGGNDGLAFWGNGYYKNDVLPPNLLITKAGYIGVNTRPEQRFHVRDGNFLLQGGIFSIQNTNNTTSVLFSIDLDSKLEGYWLGTTTNHRLTLGVEKKGCVSIFPGGYTIFYKNNDDSSNTKISQENLDKYTVFALGGILSENYGIAPKTLWADYVFDKNYKLKPLSQVEAFINEHKRLPDIPSAEQVSREGYDLHEMNVKLLEKVEELTLHVIRLEKEMQSLKQQQDSE